MRTIGAISPIEGADKIELARVDGWNVVVRKGAFKPGDQCVYFEIDSWVSVEDERFEFLKKMGAKKAIDGVERFRIKTIRFRGQISQGLALSADMFTESELNNLNEELDVIKYERQEPVHADAAGNYPPFMQKTDEKRIQNIYYDVKDRGDYKNTLFYPTIKIDGTSIQVAYIRPDSPHLMNLEEDKYISCEDGGQFLLLSRNLMLKPKADGTEMAAIAKANVLEKLKQISDELGVSVAIRGEFSGPGIQGNPERLAEFTYFPYGLLDIDNQEQISWEKCLELFGKYNVKNVVKNIEDPFKVFSRFSTIDDILKYADGKGMRADRREGIVFKGVMNGRYISFKVISNKWLLKNDG